MSERASRSTRRQFLTGQAAIQAAERLLPGEAVDAPYLGPPVPGPPVPDSTGTGSDYLVQIGRSAMACDFDVILNAGQHAGSTEAALAALDLIDELESQLTVYRESSEVIELNRRAGLETVPVEPGLFALLQLAVSLHRETGGAFDITSGPLSRVWGFFRRAGRLPDETEIATALACVGSQWLQLDDAAQTVRFTHPGLEINFNSIGKGYALDRAAERLVAAGVANFLMHGGQSSILARGSQRSAAGDEAGWRVALVHPLHPDRRLAEFRLRDRALGTSGGGTQFFYFQGRRYGHIFDPRTGYPADRVLSVTAFAPEAARADALATAFFVMGVDASLDYCAKHPEVATVFVVPGDRSGEMKLVVHGLADDELVVRS